ncbi:MAG: 30S ribosomal protein S2, partial [Proteobacteria bacterium]
IDRMRKLEELLTQASEENSKIKLNKKEKLSISRQLEKLQVSLGGIRLMKRVPDLLFVVDIVKESIAIAEANRLAIPVVALVDTNSDPDVVAFPVPSNDDASKTIRLFTAAAADAVLEGRKQYEDRMAREAPPDDGSSEDGSDEEKGVGAGEAAGGFSATESAQF